MGRLRLSLAVAVLFAPVAASLGVAATLSETFGVKASLDAAQEVPRQTVRVPAARGTFSGSLTTGSSRSRLAWRLTFRDLSGRALQGHVHIGRLGKTGPIALGLCAPCRSGMGGTTRLTASQANAIRAGRAYVNIHTKKNPQGEIRGQIRLIRGA
jgi:hypothetical protein